MTVRLVWSKVNPDKMVCRTAVQKRARKCTLLTMSTGLHEQVKKDFGQLLKAARERAGYRSAARLALILGVEPARYRYWERGQALPDIPTFVKLCHQLRVDPIDLVPSFIREKPNGKQVDHLKVVT